MAATPVNVSLAASSYERNFAGSANLRVRNRFFEDDPSSQSGFSQVARPGTDFVATIGAGPTIRATFAQQGVFNDDLFLVSGDGLYRRNSAGVNTLIAGAVGFTANFPSIAVQASPSIQRLWVADGSTLQYYEGLSKSQATLRWITGSIAANDTISIDNVHYKWVLSGVDAGTPAGTAANPWLVLLGIDSRNSLANMGMAIGNTGTPGSTYSTALVEHPTVEVRRTISNAIALIENVIIVQAKTAGAGGDSLALTEVSAALQWQKSDGSATTTLVNGGLHFLVEIKVPEFTTGKPALAVTTVSGHVIVSVSGSQRLFFILPGEFWIDTFAEAEAEPDTIVDIKAVGDLLWVFGASTIEVWAVTGDSATPFAPVQGRALRFGALRDTIFVLDGRVFYVDTSGIVRDGSGERLSTHTVEEKIRLRG